VSWLELHLALQNGMLHRGCTSLHHVSFMLLHVLRQAVSCRPALVKGFMQLYSVEQKRSQALEAHAAAFSTIKVSTALPAAFHMFIVLPLLSCPALYSITVSVAISAHGDKS